MTDDAASTDAAVASLITQVSKDPPTPGKKTDSLNLGSIKKAVDTLEEEDLSDGVDEDGGLLGPRQGKHKNMKCLVLDLDETLVHSSFKQIPKPDFLVPVDIDGVVHTVYVLKRPYTDEFLAACAKHYEIVLFTASLSKYADPLLDMLDTKSTIDHRLFREHCVQKEYCYVKDLSKLGRKLKDCIIIDNSAQSYIFQPSNAIPIPSWFDDPSDTALLDLIPVLEHLSTVKDVRKCLQANKHSFAWLLKKYGKAKS